MTKHFLTATATATGGATTTATALLVLLLTLSSFLLPSLGCPTCPNQASPPPPPPKPKPKHPPPSSVPCPPPPQKPKSPTPPAPPKSPTPPAPHQKPARCPINILKLDACVDVLGGLLHVVLGGPSAKEACCPVLAGLADIDAGLCLCTAIRAHLLGINLLLPIALDVLVDCGKRLPADYTCPAPI